MSLLKEPLVKSRRRLPGWQYRILMLILVACCSKSTVYSQMLETSVISGGGESVEISQNLLWSWTIGEPVIELQTGNGVMLVQGFHQPRLTVAPLVAVAGLKDFVSVYPNPSTDFITISLKESALAAQKVKVELRDMSGRLAYESDFKNSEHTIDVRLLSNGVYMLRLTCAEDNSLIGTYTVEKLK
jgi:hypothetical protein